MDLLEGIAIIRRRRVRDDMLCEEGQFRYSSVPSSLFNETAVFQVLTTRGLDCATFPLHFEPYEAPGAVYEQSGR